jgi:MFS family permease
MKATPQLDKSHDAYAALRIPNFRRYFAANIALFIGLQMQKVAIGWEIYERTGSALHLGYVGLAQFLPQILLTLFAGYITDNFNRKRVLMGAVAFNTLAALGLAWNSRREGAIVLMYALILCVGAARAFWMPARGAFLPRIVPLEIFSNAVSWNSSGFETASMAGPAVGGLLIAYFKSSTPVYLINFTAGLVFLILITGIKYHHEKQPRAPMTVHALSAGFSFIRKTPLVLSAMLLDTFGVLLGGATALMPIYAKDILRVGPRGLGWLVTAPAIGAFTMALVQAHRGPLRRAGRTLLFAVAGFGFVTALFGFSRIFWFSLFMLFLLGACDNISVVVRTTLIQVLTPDSMRGRVSALNGVFIGASNELGAFESGTVAALAGPVFSAVSGGIGTILVVIGIAWWFPQLRRYGRIDEAL